MNDNPVIISTGPLGGLGDHLIYSTLAERFAEQGRTVYVHEDNIARNDEILELVWGRNPHVTGSSNMTPNAGYPLQGAFYDLANQLPLGCAIEAMERAHGLPPPYSMAPKIYYTPQKPVHDVQNAVLGDFAALSSSIHPLGWERFHQKMVDRFGTGITMLTFPASVNHNQVQIPPGVPTIGVGSLYEYVDLLAHCRAWVGSEAGGQALAAAVRGSADVFDEFARPEIVCLMAPNTFNSRPFCFRGVDYRTSKYASGEDYLEPAEVPLHRYHLVCRQNVLAKRDEWRKAKQ